MPIIDFLRQAWSYAGLAILAVALVAAAIYLPRWCTRFTSPSEYSDMQEIPAMTSVGIDPAYPREQIRSGDLVCFRNPANAEDKVFARVVAIPGQSVQVVGGQVVVDGAAGRSGPVGCRDRGRFIVPSRHLFVVSDGHAFDSFAHGVLPFELILGRRE